MSRHAPVFSAVDIARACATPSRYRSMLEEVVRALSLGPDSVALWKTVRDAGLAPLLSDGAQRAGLLDHADQKVSAALRSALEVNALRNALIRRAALDATRALNAAGIVPLWVKGVWLASFVYRQPALRSMNDVDLIVPHGSGTAARDALIRAGYAPTSASEGGAAAWNWTLSRSCDLPGGSETLDLDLHETLRLSGAIVWPVDTLWRTSVEVRQAGAVFRVPTQEAGLLYCAVHLFKHGFDVRHAMVAICDALTLLSDRNHPPDLIPEGAWLDAAAAPVALALMERLSDPLEATALYMLLALADPEPESHAARLRAAAGERVDHLGARARADAILGSVQRLPLMTREDFSLFDVGESGSGWTTMARLAQGAVRWRRRVDREGGAKRSGLARLLGRANWRYAYTSYLAGRLSARLRSSTPS